MKDPKRRVVFILLCLALAGGLMTACGSAPPAPATTASEPAGAVSAQPTNAASPAGIDAAAWENWQGWKFASTLIPVRDGAKLAADVYLPSLGEAFPVILIQTPYSKALQKTQMAQIIAGDPRAPLFDSEDYAYAVTDWRGYFKSKETSKATGIKLQNGMDGYDTVEWIATQPWSNGKVLTWGSSALGRVQYMTAGQKPPHLVAGSPQVYNLMLGYTFYYPGGVLRKEHVERYDSIGFPGFGDIIKQHPLDDGAFDLDRPAKAEDIEVPMLLVGGWYDFHDMIQAYQALSERGNPKARADHRVIIGPWTHTGIARDVKEGELEFPNAASVAKKEQQKFFDYWARGIDTGEKASPRITYYLMGANQWQTTDVWPPKGVVYETLNLGAGGMLSPGNSAAGTGFDTFISDPRNPVPTRGGANLSPDVPSGAVDQRQDVESRSDVLSYTTDVLAADLTIAGPVKVQLYVSSDSVDTDVAVRLTDVYPDGRSMLVNDSIQRLSLRESFEQKKLLVPGEVYSATVNLPNTAITFLKGHRIRIDISSSNYPEFEVNKNTGKDDGEPIVATNKLFHETGHQSSLVLPVLR